jgi:hypothetical protein
MRLFLISMLIFLPGIIFSQISGIVMDKSSGYPLQYATILVENENFVTTSDIEGKFKLATDIFNKTLIISAIGFITERVVAHSKFLRIELKTKVYRMNDISVTALRNKSGIPDRGYDGESILDWYWYRNGLCVIAGSQMNSLRSAPDSGTELKRKDKQDFNR